MGDSEKFPFKVEELAPVLNLLKHVEGNLHLVRTEWEETKRAVVASAGLNPLPPGDVIVSRSQLDRLTSQHDQTRQLLPHIASCSRDLVAKVNSLEQLEQDHQTLTEERDGLTSEVIHWKAQLSEAVNQAQKDKQANLNYQMDLHSMTTQLCDQSEFCSGLGSTLATVLWRLSRQEDAVVSIVTGSKLADLLTLTSSCVQSFQSAYKDDQDDQWPDKSSVEANFILALTGTFTNLAASAVGREQLATRTEGLAVVDTFLTFLSDAPSTQTAPMKSLMLTALYNLSINQKGVKYLCNQPDLIARLTTILQSDVSDHQAITLRLIMSLIAEEDSLSNIVLQLRESLPKGCVERLASSGSGELKQLALELLSDVRNAEMEP